MHNPCPTRPNVDLNLEMFNDGRLATNARGSLTAPTETWVAEIFSPPYLFIDGQRRATIVSLERQPMPDHPFESVINGKRYYLIRSHSQYILNLANLPRKCSAKSTDKVVLIKLGSATHGWDGGQRLINLSFKRMASMSALQLTTPDAKIALIVPGFYMLFYVDCMGKPSVAQMVRFDDQAVQV